MAGSEEAVADLEVGEVGVAAADAVLGEAAVLEVSVTEDDLCLLSQVYPYTIPGSILLKPAYMMHSSSSAEKILPSNTRRTRVPWGS